MPNANYGSSFCGYAEFPCTVPRTVEIKPPTNGTPVAQSSATPPDNTPQPTTTPVTG